MIAEAQLQQEARRVLRRLAAPRTHLFARDDGFVVGRSAVSRVGVTTEVVQAFVQRQWIAGDGPGRCRRARPIMSGPTTSCSILAPTASSSSA